MKERLVELITLISSGSMRDEDIQRIADEAARAYADPQAFLAANPGIDHEPGSPVPLGESVLIGGLPDGVLLQAKGADELLRQITATFGAESALHLKADELASAELLDALKRIQMELSSLNPDAGGYELLDFSEPLETELQMVLIYTRDLPRVMELTMDLGIYAAPAYESRLTELGDGEDG